MSFYIDYNKGVLPTLNTATQISQVFDSLDGYFDKRGRTNTDREVARIIIVRHGESIANQLGINAGQLGTYAGQDISLTQKGIEQSKEAARVLATKIDHVSGVYITPLVRTKQTYDALATEWKFIKDEILPDPQIEPGLLERCCGCLEGAKKINYDPLKIKEQADVAALSTFEEKMSYKMVSEDRYESYADAWKRAVAALTKLARKHFRETIVIVGHVGIQRALMLGSAAAQQNPVALDYRSFDIPNGCIMVIESNGEGISFKATSPLKFS